jgi:hypothetical protein
MTTTLTRAAAGGVLAALLTTAGAISALGAGAAQAATIDHGPGYRTVTLSPSEIRSAASSDPTFDQQVCSDVWLGGTALCASSLHACAHQYSTSTVSIVAKLDVAGGLVTCTVAATR